MKQAVCSKCGRPLRQVLDDDDTEEIVCPPCDRKMRTQPLVVDLDKRRDTRTFATLMLQHAETFRQIAFAVRCDAPNKVVEKLVRADRELLDRLEEATRCCALLAESLPPDEHAKFLSSFRAQREEWERWLDVGGDGGCISR